MAALIQELASIGEVTLVRYVGETMWITFRDGESALKAQALRQLNICDVQLHLKLKTENWLDQVEQEIELCTTNTVKLCDTPTQSVDYNCLGIPKVPPQRPKSPAGRVPPSRPPMPKSPTASPKHHHSAPPKAGVISVNPELLGKLNKNQPLQHQQQQPLTSNSSQQSTPAGTPGEPHRSPPSLSNQESLSSAIYEEINDDVNCGLICE